MAAVERRVHVVPDTALPGPGERHEDSIPIVEFEFPGISFVRPSLATFMDGTGLALIQTGRIFVALSLVKPRHFNIRVLPHRFLVLFLSAFFLYFVSLLGD